MATETQTRTGDCPTHGEVEATRELPRVTFPPIINAHPPRNRQTTAVPMPDLWRRQSRPIDLRERFGDASVVYTHAASVTPWATPAPTRVVGRRRPR